MQTYSASCQKKKNTENKNVKIVRTKKGRLQMRSLYSVCENKKNKFVTEQEAKGILSKIPG